MASAVKFVRSLCPAPRRLVRANYADILFCLQVFMDPAACDAWLETMSTGNIIELLNQFFIAMLQTLLVSYDVRLIILWGDPD